MAPHSEPVIVVNGQTLLSAQSSVVRVALAHLQTEVSAPGMSDPDRLGPVVHAYRERISEVLALILDPA